MPDQLRMPRRSSNWLGIDFKSSLIDSVLLTQIAGGENYGGTFGFERGSNKDPSGVL